jgi:peroxiredoxin
LSRETAERRHLSFDILWDKGNEVAARYGLRFRLPDDLIAIYKKVGVDLPKANGDESWTLPMPARFVIDRGGIVRAVDADPDYTRRPEPAKTVEALRGLRR